MNLQKKPMIALTPYHNQEKDEAYMRPAYFNAISAADGIPVILPPEADDRDLASLVGTFDGFLFTGGPDVHPFHFGEETHAQCGNISARRDTLELALLRRVMEVRKPILGICRGVQLLNIGLGGDIYQDLPSQFHPDFPIAHAQPFAYEIPSHTVTIVSGTRLASIAGGASRLKVNSMHHQAVRQVAEGLVVSAYAPSGLAEAIEKPDYPFFLGVQWHPEYLWQQDSTAKAIFQSFVDACK